MTLESKPVRVEVQDYLAENYHRAKPLNLRKKLPTAAIIPNEKTPANVKGPAWNGHRVKRKKK